MFEIAVEWTSGPLRGFVTMEQIMSCWKEIYCPGSHWALDSSTFVVLYHVKGVRS